MTRLQAGVRGAGPTAACGAQAQPAQSGALSRQSACMVPAGPAGMHMRRSGRALRTVHLHDARRRAATRAQPQLEQLRQHDRGRVRQVHAGLRAAGRDRAAVRAQRQLRVLRAGPGAGQAGRASMRGMQCVCVMFTNPACASSAS